MSATATEPPTAVGETSATRRLGRLPTALAGVAIAAAVIGICVWPLIHATEFILYDWFAHVWYIWHQEGSIRAHGLPSLFAQDTSGVFDPHFAFYGGTLYAIAGALALVLGHDAAFIATWVLAFAMAYGAWFWIARQAGLGPWASHAPGVLFVTSPWYLSSTYVLANWAQTVSFSALLLSIAAALSILRTGRLRPAPTLALAVGTLLYTGSHNLTLVWATAVLAIVGAAFLVFVPACRALLTRRGLLSVAAVMVPAALVNAWFLLPAIAYQSHTAIAADVSTAHQLLRTSADLVTAQHTLSLSRASADPLLPRFALQLPLLAIGWIVVGLAVLRPDRRSPWLRTALILLVAMVATWVLMSHSGLVLGLPRPFDMLQGLYRLEAYVQLALGGAVIAVLALALRSSEPRRRWAWLVVPVLLVSVVQARSQVTDPMVPPLKGPLGTTAPYLTEQSQLTTADYVNADVPLWVPVAPITVVMFPATTAEQEDRAEATFAAKPGERVGSNLKVSNPLVHVSGAHIVARAPNGNAFLEIDGEATRGTAHIVVTAAHPWPVTVGRLLTLLGLLGLLGVGAVSLRGRRR